MITISWVEFDGVEIDESRTEWRDGILRHAANIGLPVARAVNYSDDESPKMMKRAKAYVASDMADRACVVVARCGSLGEAKAKSMGKL